MPVVVSVVNDHMFLQTYKTSIRSNHMRKLTKLLSRAILNDFPENLAKIVLIHKYMLIER
jgi:hypothetical protein